MSLDRSVPPKPGLPRDVHFPDYHERVLSNGLKVIVYENRGIPTVTVNIVSRYGAAFDGDAHGLASLAAEMLTKGTASRSATQIVDEVEFFGGAIGAGATWDSTSVGFSILSRYLDKAMEIAADITLNPVFQQDELERLVEQRMSSIVQRKSTPTYLAQTRFQQAVFQAHPYAHHLEGTEASIPAIGRERLASFHANAFVPSQMLIIACGDVDADSFTALIEKLFDGKNGAAAPSQAFAFPETPVGRAVKIVDRPSAVQSSIIVGHVGIARNDPDFIAVSTMNMILGGYFGSRLNMNLREEKGFTYGAYSRFDARALPGPFYATAEVGNDVTDEAVEAMIGEIERLAAEPVAPEELEAAQRYVTGSFPLQIETPVQVAQRVLNIELYGLGKTYYNTYNSRVLALTVDDILRVAQERLQPERLQIVLSGKAAALAEKLERIGTVELFDADGNTIPHSFTE